MISHLKGDILKSEAEGIVNTVNCVGVMGGGLALQFKKAYPDNADFYEKACARGEVKPGQVLVYATGRLIPPLYIFNFPTKRHWRGRSRIEDIEVGLTSLAKEVKALNLRSVAIPPLGSGLGHLDWNLVLPLIANAANRMEGVKVQIYHPFQGTIVQPAGRADDPPAMTSVRAALMTAVNKYLAALMDTECTVLEVHKLAYFLQESGEQMRLRFVQAPHGPYGENLPYLLKAMNRHFIDIDPNALNTPGTALHILPGAVEDSKEFMVRNPATSRRVLRVLNLAAGFETPFGLELLASVHWVMKRMRQKTLDGITSHLYRWSPGKSQFSIPQIELAVQRLQSQHWV